MTKCRLNCIDGGAWIFKAKDRQIDLPSLLPFHMNNDSTLTDLPRSVSSLGQYSCPICSKDLTHLKSSFSRQQHVETCLESNVEDTTEMQQDMEFCYCLFCGKDIQHLSGIRQELHFNKCLDQLELEAHPAFLRDLEICPCCHEFDPFRRAVPQKIAHLKSCMRRRGMTVPQLFNKLQWIEWGHDPKPNRPKHHHPPPTSQQKSGSLSSSSKRREALEYYYCQNQDNDDDDFKAPIFVKKRLQPAAKEELDDETRLALQISKRKERKPKADPNVCNVVSIDDSRRLAAQALQELLFPESTINLPVTIYPQIPPTSLYRSPHEPSLWELAAGSCKETDYDHIYIAKFLRCRNL